MAKVINLFEYNTASMLRSIADDIDSGDMPKTDCTVILGSEIMHSGGRDGRESAMQVIWNCTRAIHKLQYAVDSNLS